MNGQPLCPADITRVKAGRSNVGRDFTILFSIQMPGNDIARTVFSTSDKEKGEKLAELFLDMRFIGAQEVSGFALTETNWECVPCDKS